MFHLLKGYLRSGLLPPWLLPDFSSKLFKTKSLSRSWSFIFLPLNERLKYLSEQRVHLLCFSLQRAMTVSLLLCTVIMRVRRGFWWINRSTCASTAWSWSFKSMCSFLLNCLGESLKACRHATRFPRRCSCCSPHHSPASTFYICEAIQTSIVNLSSCKEQVSSPSRYKPSSVGCRLPCDLLRVPNIFLIWFSYF